MAEYVFVNGGVVCFYFLDGLYCVCPPMFVGGCERGAGRFIKT